MSYLVFARKWRPKNFDEVVGQDHITKTLKNAIQSHKLAHAYLFSGPQGVGKTSCARILARALECQEGPTDKPCGKCPACLEIEEGRSMDVIEIDGASNRGIDEIRALRENVKFAPLGGKYKIYIIDEVHMLTPEAFNALLKTLEEPPEFVKFIFATTQPQKVLGTILSRCQRFDFARIPNLKIVAKLKEIAAEEKLRIPEDVMFAIAKSADGCMRDAQSVLDQMIAFSQKDIKLSDVVEVLGIIEEDVFLKFVDSCLGGDASAAIHLISDVSSRGKDMNYFLEGLLQHYRNLMVLKVVRDKGEGLIDVPGELAAHLAKQAQKLSLNEIMMAINNIFAAQEMSRKLNTVRIPLEILAVKISLAGKKQTELTGQAAPQKQAPAPAKSQEPVAKKTFSILREERGSVDTSLSSLTPPEPAQAQHPKDEGHVSCTLEDVKNSWDRLIRHLSGVKMSLSTYLRQAAPLKLEGYFLTVGFPKTAVFFKETLEHKDNLRIVEQAVADVTGEKLRLKLEVSETLIAPAQEDDPVEETPFLKSTLDLFKGKIIKK
ncbi:MAG: DNA polymerase III subunit gamma/tau [Candidatus Omnitrophota bacterium]